jgi:hypothetical protein
MGASKVVSVAPDGTISDAWTGLTMLSAVGIGIDGSLFAAELSTGNSDTPPYYRRAAGRIVRQTGPASLEEVATGLDLPIAIAFGPDDGLYVALPALSQEAQLGAIVRIETDGTLPLTMPADLRSAACATESRASASQVASTATSPAG